MEKACAAASVTAMKDGGFVGTYDAVSEALRTEQRGAGGADDGSNNIADQAADEVLDAGICKALSDEGATTIATAKSRAAAAAAETAETEQAPSHHLLEGLKEWAAAFESGRRLLIALIVGC
jgi:hypothetical protein